MLVEYISFSPSTCNNFSFQLMTLLAYLFRKEKPLGKGFHKLPLAHTFACIFAHWLWLHKLYFEWMSLVSTWALYLLCTYPRTLLLGSRAEAQELWCMGLWTTSSCPGIILEQGSDPCYCIGGGCLTTGQPGKFTPFLLLDDFFNIQTFLKCLTTGKLLNKWWYIHTMYNEVEKLLIQPATWMDLKDMQSEKKPISKGHILYDSIYITF